MKCRWIGSLVVIAVIVLATNALAGIPRLINYQGVLTDSGGSPISGSHDLTFSIYDDSLASTPMWTELHPGVSIDEGLFDVILGGITNLPDSVFATEERWMGIKVDTDPEMAPRMQITSVPWAFRAAVADSAVAISDIPSHTHDDRYFTESEVNVNDGTVNEPSDPVDWTKLKSVPAGFADGTDDVGETGGGDGHSLDASDGSPEDVVYVDTEGNVGVGITSPLAKLHVAEDDTVLFGASTEGIGSKLMWIPSEAAFRAGRVIGSQWDGANMGYNSTAWGFGTTANGLRSTAMGLNTTASGYNSTAMGALTTASGNESTALGGSTTASGETSIAMGKNTTASGMSSTAMGFYTKAESRRSVVLGRYNVGGGSPAAWIDTDPLFEIGIGSDDANRANAMTVLKNGNVGIGTTTPTYKLDVTDTVQVASFKMPAGASNGYVLTSDASGAGSWQEPSAVSDGDWQISGNDMYSNVSGNVGIGTSSPNAPFQVASGKTVLFGADTLGAGSRLMWIPSKEAFRAGKVVGPVWDWANIGYRSTATGYHTLASGYSSTAMGDAAKASGEASTAMGNLTTASGEASTAMGDSAVASGDASIALGKRTRASGPYSTSMGANTTAMGMNSTAMGFYTNAESRLSMALGRYNVGGGHQTLWIETDPLFEIGIGNDDANRANAMTVLKNGNVGIGVTSPQTKLHVAEDDTVLFGASTEGIGSKLMWIPSEAAFRAGLVTGSQWDGANIGGWSTAMGKNTTASGATSTAMGDATTASGNASTAIGWKSNATAAYSVAAGFETKAESYISTAIGRYNVGGGDPASWIETDPLFEIGNGEWSSPGSRRNAMTVLKNGNVGIGTNTPEYRLSVAGNDTITQFFSSGENGVAVYGKAGGTNAYGVVGYSFGGGIGVYGKALSGYAGSFSGDVWVTGYLSKAGGGFLIDHPLDPENKLLRHNFVESPENLLIYRGKANLDADGEAIIELPNYFKALAKENEATVTLTSVGRPFLTGYEWQSDNTSFKVYGEPNREVSWVVYADRDDPVIHQIGKPVEEEKGPSNKLCDRGEFLNPTAYGYPESKGKDYENRLRR